MSKPLAPSLAPIALAAAVFALRDDGGAGAPGRCRGAVSRGDWHLASPLCQAAFDAAPHPETRLLLARTRMSLGRDDEALPLVQGALDTPLRPQALQLTGILLDRRGEAEAARAALAEALAQLRALGDGRESARAARPLRIAARPIFPLAAARSSPPRWPEGQSMEATHPGRGRHRSRTNLFKRRNSLPSEAQQRSPRRAGRSAGASSRDGQKNHASRPGDLRRARRLRQQRHLHDREPRAVGHPSGARRFRRDHVA